MPDAISEFSAVYKPNDRNGCPHDPCAHGTSHDPGTDHNANPNADRCLLPGHAFE